MKVRLGFPILKMWYPGGDWHPGWGVNLNHLISPTGSKTAAWISWAAFKAAKCWYVVQLLPPVCSYYRRSNKTRTNILVRIYYIDTGVCLKMTGAGRQVCLRGLFRRFVLWYVSGVCFGACFAPLPSSRKTTLRGLMFRRSASPKSNFPPLLEVGNPEIQTPTLLFNN